jgi:hypothetical protein
MPETVDIPVVDLLFDLTNARLPDDATTQQVAALELARQQQGQLVNLAADIVANGIDPLSLTAVVATGDRRKRYIVMEGNRRLLALRALETPSLVNPVLSPRDARRLATLARRFAEDPLTTVRCVRFDSEDDALHWIRLRHTSGHEGAGVVRWGSAEQDRFNARHQGTRRPGGQVLDFLTQQTGVATTEPIITTLDRLLTTPAARRKLGVEIKRGQVLGLFPAEQLTRSLGAVVDDMRTGRITVRDVYGADDRVRYVEERLPTQNLPNPETALAAPVPLGELRGEESSATKRARNKKTTKRQAQNPPRTTVIPRDAPLDVTTPRINRVFEELSTLNVEQYTNAASVLLRVFVELSVDHFIEQEKLMDDRTIRQTPLAKRMKATAAHLANQGKIPDRLRTAVERVADGGAGSVLAPAVPTMNQYVHNQYVFPRPTELYVAWDELAPFLAQLWPR